MAMGGSPDRSIFHTWTRRRYSTRDGSAQMSPESTKQAIPKKSAYALGMTGKASASINRTPDAEKHHEIVLLVVWVIWPLLLRVLYIIENIERSVNGDSRALGRHARLPVR